MNYTLTILEEQYDHLVGEVFGLPGCEGAAYLLCGRSNTENETRLLVREVIPVQGNHYLVREPLRLSIASESYVAVAKKARLHGDSIVFVHSHPEGFCDFSQQDDQEDGKLHPFLHDRVPGVPHASLVLISGSDSRGRVWSKGGWSPISWVRVIGRRFRFTGKTADQKPLPQFFDRQVRAFGPEIQQLLRRLHVGVVGAGGTGSAVLEQLARLGVGTLSIFDGDAFDDTNVNRVYGSSISDAGRNKAELAAANVERTGLGTRLHVHPTHITRETTARCLRECDVVFGCTDRHAPRGILVQLALRYLIPLLDLGVKLDSQDGTLTGVFGRVTTFYPGEACLFCRGRISPDMIRLESLTPEERQALADENYAPELDGPAPAVVAFTTAVAAQAVSELLHRLTGFMGPNRTSSEVLLLLGESRLRANRETRGADCLCSQVKLWGSGDSRRFLDMTWPHGDANR